MNLHQKNPVGQPRVMSLNDRAVFHHHPGETQRYEQADERWYRQVKETKCDGNGKSWHANSTGDGGESQPGEPPEERGVSGHGPAVGQHEGWVLSTRAKTSVFVSV